MIEPLALPRVGRRHGCARVGEDEALQQRLGAVAVLGAPVARALLEDGVNAVPEVLADDGVMLAGIGRALMHRLAQIDAAAKQLVDETLVDPLAALVANVFGLQRPSQCRRRAKGCEALKIIRTVAASASLTTSLRSLTS